VTVDVRYYYGYPSGGTGMVIPTDTEGMVLQAWLRISQQRYRRHGLARLGENIPVEI
jgi:hypothetical protein